jgi:hypothetical protein
MAVMGNADLVATKNQLIISLVQKELIAKSVLMGSGAVSDFSAYAVKGTKSISVPRAGSFTVEDRATGVAAALASVTYATDTITLGEMSTISWVVDSQDELESSVDVQMDLAGRAAKGHAANFDSKIIAGLEAASTATTTAGAISKAIFLEMQQSLISAYADPSSLKFLCGPDSYSALLAISEFVQQYSVGSAIIPTGVLGQLYGVQILMSAQVAANRFYMFSSDGYGFAIQKALSIGERPSPEYGVGSVLKVMDQKWGHGALENSLLLKKDNN